MTATLPLLKPRTVTLWDGREWLGYDVDGMPGFRFKWAPAGLATRRQLRELGLCPGGHEPYGQLVWRRGRRFAWLYRLDLAKPSRVPSPAQLAALGKAMAARRRCGACEQDAGYCVPTSDGRCWDCILGPDAAEQEQAA